MIEGGGGGDGSVGRQKSMTAIFLARQCIF